MDFKIGNGVAEAEERELKVFKVLILGDSGTGKTALVRRSVHDFFTEGYRSTIGVDFSLKVLRWTEDLEIRLQMWDLAGQDRFNHLSRLYFNKAQGALLVCDQNSEQSIEGVIKWKKELDSKLHDTPAVILVNKEDLREESGASNDDIAMEELARDLNIVSWTRTSAKTGSGVEEGIRSLVWQMLEREHSLMYGDSLSRSDSIITLTRPDQKQNCSNMCWNYSRKTSFIK